jgi:F-type H+-transporting ATPase subunit epsilon
MTLKLDIVTAERVVLPGDVDEVIAPGPWATRNSAPPRPVMTTSRPENCCKTGRRRADLAISGGFLEVAPGSRDYLADLAERAEDIDLARAEKRVTAPRPVLRRGQRNRRRPGRSALRAPLVRPSVAEKIKTRRKV